MAKKQDEKTDEGVQPLKTEAPDEQSSPPSIPKAFQQQPSVGRIVHYRRKDDREGKGQPYAAIITHVLNPTVVNLRIFDDGLYTLNENALSTSVKQGTGPGQWSWPPKV